MIICICNAVSDRHIRSAIADGNRTLEDLQVELGVATRCGKCRSAACDVLERELCGAACATPSLTQDMTRFGRRIALIPASRSPKAWFLPEYDRQEFALRSVGLNGQIKTPVKSLLPLHFEIAMQGNRDVLDFLNRQLTNELTAINQYFLHARIYRHWGIKALGEIEYKESIGEMKHADKLIERILTLGGLPNLQDLHKLLLGETTPEILGCDLKLELISQSTVKDAIACCEKERDFVSRMIFQEILDDTEEHIDWLETQIELIDRVGLENYQQTMIGSPD